MPYDSKITHFTKHVDKTSQTNAVHKIVPRAVDNITALFCYKVANLYTFWNINKIWIPSRKKCSTTE